MSFFESPEELESAVADIAGLSPATRRVLASVIAETGRKVTKVSPSAKVLEDLGFIFIRNICFYDGSATLDPSLWGEEAYGEWEDRKCTPAGCSPTLNEAVS